MSMIMKASFWRWLTLLAFIPSMTATVHATAASLDDLLARSSAPPGVVFEIVDRDPRALEVALPWVKQASQQLKVRFPDLPMALVTHGQEMFALQSGARESNAAIHRLAKSLSHDDGIPVHVCETYAGRRGLAAEDFPAYIDVAPTGPTQIRNYEALDYVRLVVPRSAALAPR
jgi:intracellular sulfur oxidation DsrE/DsrF family protein